MAVIKCIVEVVLLFIRFLNQVRASLQLAHIWFLEITFMRLSVCVLACVRMCVSAPEAINNKWRDIQLLIGLAIDTVNGCGLSKKVCHEFLPKNTKVMLY